MTEEKIKLVTNNKKAYHDYFIEEKHECGISLVGTEVKSIRMGKCSIKEAFIIFQGNEAMICGMNISPYEKGNIFNRDPLRPRKLLMHRREINRLMGLVAQQGFTLIPLSIYFKGSRVKVQLGLCRGKKLYDKREDMARRDAKRDMERALKERQ